MKRDIVLKDRMIDRLADELRKQKNFKVLTYKECEEKYGKKTDEYMVRCYYPDRITPSMLTAYVKNDYVWIVGHAEDFQRFESEDVFESMPYKKGLYKFKIVEPFENGLVKTSRVLFEMFDYCLQMHPEYKN